MMKKLLACFLCLMLLPVLSLAEEAAPVPPTFEWERNPAGHWRVLESGETADKGIHTLGDDMTCSVCGAEVWVFDDLSADIYDYDAFGNTLRFTSYDSEGTITYDSVQDLTYDEEGHVLRALEFINGTLFGEYTFTVNVEGESIPVTQYAWYEDGTWALNEYDEYGNCIRAISCDAEDHITSETLSEYKLGPDGWYYESRNQTILGESVFLKEYNEFGDTIHSLIVEAGQALMDHTYEYGYDGYTKLWCKMYDHGRLSRESLYDPETASLIKETEYYDDGTSTISEFNLIGDPLSILFLLPDGTVEMTQTFEYVYDEHETQLSCKAYVNDVLVLHTEYAATEDGWSYTTRETMYNEDGTYVVCLFDAEENLVSETTYDAQGNVIE